MVASTWENRDLLVLRAVVEICDDDAWGMAEVGEIAERTGINEPDVNKALWKLAGERPSFFELSDQSTFGGRDIGGVSNPSGHAQRTVGAWPTPESLVERMMAALNDAADRAETAEEKTRLKRAADALGGVVKGVITGVLTH